MIQDILNRRIQSGQQSYYTTVNNLKAAAKVYNFLANNGIESMAELEEKVMAMYKEQGSLSEKLKPIERRIKTLDEHLRHSENYKSGYHHKVQYEKLYAKHEAIKKAGGFRADSKAQKALDAANAYYRDHDSEIVLFEAAERYLKDVLQKRFDPKKLPPIAKWKAERDRMIGEKEQLSQQYRTLKDEVKEVE